MSNLNRREFLRLTAGSAAAAVVPFGGCDSELAKQQAPPGKRPNIIFLLTDDQRWDTTGCAGNSIIQTPNIDDMAENGVMFKNAFVTSAICAVSRASIFSGQYARRHGILDFSTSFSKQAQAQTYPMLLRRAGYRTGFVGKYGVGKAEDMPRDEFDLWYGCAASQCGPYERKDENGNYKHLTRFTGEQAIEFLRTCSAEVPFCLSVSFKAPHVQGSHPLQFVADRAYKDLYKDITIPTPKTAEPRYFEALPRFLQESEARKRWQTRFATPDKFQESVKNYYRLITGVDIMIGQIRQELKQLGFDDNTVIILTGDNGFYLGERGLAGKWFPHEESIRVPLIIYDPRFAKKKGGQVQSQIALNIDIAPTILSMAGVSIPEQMQGSSLVPLMNGKKPKWRTDFFYEHLFDHPGIPKSEALGSQDWKYIRYIEHDYEELYDLKNDPQETKNLAKEEKYRRTLESLRKRCDKLLERAKGKRTSIRTG